jgi:hypothetical protein
MLRPACPGVLNHIAALSILTLDFRKLMAKSMPFELSSHADVSVANEILLTVKNRDCPVANERIPRRLHRIVRVGALN